MPDCQPVCGGISLRLELLAELPTAVDLHELADEGGVAGEPGAEQRYGIGYRWVDYLVCCCAIGASVALATGDRGTGTCAATTTASSP